MSKLTLATARTFIGLMALGMALVTGLAPANAQDASSSPDDRARFVSITRRLEIDPLQATARADRSWALAWLTDAPDVSVSACLSSLGGMTNDYSYAGEITLQYIFAMAVLIIEQPETADDPTAQQVAGVEGALRAYRAILAKNPDAASSGLDSLVAMEGRGELPAFIRGGAEDCSAAD